MENNEKQVVAIPQKAGEMFLDVKMFEQVQRVAKLFAESDLVPTIFQKNLPNCVIAFNLASRMECDPFMLMQNMYVVHGKPGLEGKMVIALLNQCGRFSPLKYKFDGEGDEYGCTAYCTEKESNEVLEGPKVTMAMVKAEGWDKPKGTMTSKWLTMPALMFRYRAGAFFARTNCPDIIMGMHVKEELEDAVDMIKTQDGSFKAKGAVNLEDVMEGDVVREPDRDEQKKIDNEPKPIVLPDEDNEEPAVSEPVEPPPVDAEPIKTPEPEKPKRGRGRPRKETPVTPEPEEKDNEEAIAPDSEDDPDLPPAETTTVDEDGNIIW